MRVLLIVLFTTFIAACNSSNIVVQQLNFQDIQSDLVVTDKNSYGCEPPSLEDIKHIMRTGTIVTRRESHDRFSTVGCSVKGATIYNEQRMEFTFEFGGMIFLSNGQILACRESYCIQEGFEYCTYEKHDN